jgi:hypothetical protein
MYCLERLADFYYLSGDSAAFFSVSGWRLILFIVFTLAGSLGAGVLLEDVWEATAAEGVSLLAALLAFNVFCDPRVCFSSGPDGLEPLRLGIFLGSVAVSGAALGVALRRRQSSRPTLLLTGFFGYAAIGYYPAIFTFAGTRLLGSLYPWDVAVVLVIAAYPVSVAVSSSMGTRVGIFIPLASLAALFAISAGISTAYFGALVPVMGLMVASTVVAAAAGAATAAARKGGAGTHRSAISGLFAIGLVLVLSMMLFGVPDAVSGVVPSAGASSPFAMGVPVYAGAYMDAAPGHSSGAGVTVDFAGTNVSSIQQDNFLAAGIGIHSAGCCVDGIDYSYRFDLYLFHGGGESLEASAWEACDDNAACGGHSWKVLMFLKSESLDGANSSKSVHLAMAWAAGPTRPEVVWSYSISGGSPVNFTDFVVPGPENPDFNTGVVPGGTLGPQQTGSYFFQFGIMSRYPIGHGGWTVALTCPSILTSEWNCVDHAETLAGDQSFWKVFWRWGEDYPGVSVNSAQAQRLVFEYSSTTATSFRVLW